MGELACHPRPVGARQNAAFHVPLTLATSAAVPRATSLCKRRPRGERSCAGRSRRLAPVVPTARAGDRGGGSDGDGGDSEPAVFSPGEVVSGRYTITGVLGRGASGTTFEARDGANGGQAVALKVLSLRGMRSWKILDLFKREGDALRGLSHPAIPAFIDSVELDLGGDRLFVLVQRKADGESLQALLDRGQRFTPPQTASIFRQLLEVLRYLGELNPPLLHRDVKPANVIVDIVRKRGSDPDVMVSLVDFGGVNTGISKGSVASTLVGTFGFMPPEAFGGGADARSDLYAAAATMLFVVTGLSPSQVPQARLKLDVEAVVPSSRRLELGNVFTVMRKLLEPAPEDRYQTARQALEALTSRNRPAKPAESRRRDKIGRANFGAFDSAFDDGFGNGDGFYSGGMDSPTVGGSRGGGMRGRARLPSRSAPGAMQSVRRRTRGGGGALKSTRTRQPAGSRVVLERDEESRLLRVFVPPKGFTAQTAATGAFAITWTGFVGFWTAGVVTGGAPLVAGLFSLPFWFAGFKMGKRVVDDLRGTTELVISAGGGQKEVYFFSLRVAGALGDVKLAEGDARDLDSAVVEDTVYVNQDGTETRTSSMVLKEGVRTHALGEDLGDVEQDWLCNEINSFLQDADLG